MAGLAEVAPGVYVHRHPVLDVNATLIVGEDRALLVDTLSGPAQGAALAEEVRRVTPAPLALVNTHHHFDHCFGNAAFGEAGGAIWAHRDAVAQLRDHGPRWQHTWYEQWLPTEPELAEDLGRAVIAVPNRVVHRAATLDVGGRRVELRHLGRGHTEGDLVVLVADAGVVLAGDLVEQGAPPDFGDSYPLEWPETVAALLNLISTDAVVVPGHGAPVDRGFVEHQHGQLSELDWLIRYGHRDRATEQAVAARSPFGPDASLVAVRRGFAELTGGV
ncbi:MBL fold metallo-hydrolase [Rugosimonospora acidiphila]|uniref:MBL fold metallo-hydrolase n=1 Tax=Rugosimonospora acidiphila TaxID=556531 RepID=A0ABP9S7X8_9ACTN